MKIIENKIADLESAYIIQKMKIGGEERIVAATEGYGPVLLISPPDWTVTTLAEGPGGVLGISEVPGDDKALYIIMECFPGYNFHGSGVYYWRSDAEVTQPWTGKKILDLPFLHRIQALEIGGRNHLIAASIAQTKETPEDWSRPGAVYAVDFPNAPDEPTPLRPVLSQLHKNHGMKLTQAFGRREFFISGVEGMYRLVVPANGTDVWPVELDTENEISEMVFNDIDGDGKLEMMTIEPFHGHRLGIHRQGPGGWELAGEQEISYGHGLWTGTIAEKPAVIVGNRAAGKELMLYQPKTAGSLELEATILGEGAGPAHVAVVNENDGDIVFAAAQEKAQISSYVLQH